MKLTKTIPFSEAYINIPIGKSKIKEADYLPKGKYRIIDQGKSLIAGFTDLEDYLKKDFPYILFGDHTRVVKYIDSPFVAGADGVRLFKASEEFEPKFLFYFLKSIILPSDAYGRHSKYLEEILVPKISKSKQLEIVENLEKQNEQIQKAQDALILQMNEVNCLANTIIYDSLKHNPLFNYSLNDVLDEVKNGIGENWKNYRVYGATRKGIALAKEQPGKYPQRYKPVVPGTVFYNPMRILIGSIAFAEDDIEDGITSPDYVVLKGKEGIVHSRWFYYWLRSPLGQQCINSLTRGAVRERMLFNRLVEGNIDLPDFTIQEKAAEALKNLKDVRANLTKQNQDLMTLPNRLLSKIFHEGKKKI